MIEALKNPSVAGALMSRLPSPWGFVAFGKQALFQGVLILLKQALSQAPCQHGQRIHVALLGQAFLPPATPSSSSSESSD